MNQELDLLDKVELRFGLAQNESDFESQLMGLLVPVLMKLESPHQQVRDKVRIDSSFKEILEEIFYLVFKSSNHQIIKSSSHHLIPCLSI